MPEKPTNRWYRFSLRELLLLIALAGTAIGWWMDRHIWRRDDYFMLESIASGLDDAKREESTGSSGICIGGDIDIEWSIKKRDRE